MAITIKNIPILEKDVALRFETNAQNSLARKSLIKFRKELDISAKILAKAKI